MGGDPPVFTPRVMNLLPQLVQNCRVMANAVKLTFRGLPVLPTMPGVAARYIASSWMRDITVSRIQASFLPSLVDALYLLKQGGAALDWQNLERWTDDDLPTASLYALLTYLTSRGLSRLPLHVGESLATRQTLVGGTAVAHYSRDDRSSPGRQCSLAQRAAASRGGPLQLSQAMGEA